MRFSRVTASVAALGVIVALAAPVSALGHPEHAQKNRDDGPAGVTIGLDRGDPNGANGTIKIDGVELDGTFNGHPNNEPHVGQCTFQVDFYGFDVGDTADLSFTLWSPSGPKDALGITGWYPNSIDRDDDPFDLNNVTLIGTMTEKLTGIVIGEDGAGGGIDIDNQVYIELSGLKKPHPKHGYHVKAEAEITSKGRTYTKTKVFWVAGDCSGVSDSSN